MEELWQEKQKFGTSETYGGPVSKEKYETGLRKFQNPKLSSRLRP